MLQQERTNFQIVSLMKKLVIRLPQRHGLIVLKIIA